MSGRGIATRYVDLSVLQSSLPCLTFQKVLHLGFEHDARWRAFFFAVQAFFLLFCICWPDVAASRIERSKQASVHTVVYLPTYKAMHERQFLFTTSHQLLFFFSTDFWFFGVDFRASLIALLCAF